MFAYNYEDLSRIARSEIGQKYIQPIKNEYEREYQGKPIYAFDYSLFKRFYIDGNRGAFLFLSTWSGPHSWTRSSSESHS